MKKLKIIFWMIIFAILFIFGYHNSEFFMTKHILDLKYGFGEYKTPELPMVVHWIIFLAVAAGVWFIYTLPQKLKAKKEMRKMQNVEMGHLKEIAALRRRIDGFQSQATAAEEEKAHPQKETAVTANDAPVTATVEQTPDS
jgi:NADH:ubiquinone oxidoreductase subunit 5 (subunit L)/multisubunit Na+/H+ antiporter MnhA subunit